MHVLRGPHYLERLNNPTPLTRRTAPQSTNLSRGDTTVELSLGVSQGSAMCTLAFGPEAGRETLRAHGAADAFERESWVHEMTLPHLPERYQI